MTSQFTTCINTVGTEASGPCPLLGVHRESKGWCQNPEQNQLRRCRRLAAVSEGLRHTAVDLIYAEHAPMLLLCYASRSMAKECSPNCAIVIAQTLALGVPFRSPPECSEAAPDHVLLRLTFQSLEPPHFSKAACPPPERRLASARLWLPPLQLPQLPEPPGCRSPVQSVAGARLQQLQQLPHLQAGTSNGRSGLHCVCAACQCSAGGSQQHRYSRVHGQDSSGCWAHMQRPCELRMHALVARTRGILKGCCKSLKGIRIPPVA